MGQLTIKEHFAFVYDAYSKDDGAIKSEHIIKYMERLLNYDKSRGINKTVKELFDRVNTFGAYISTVPDKVKSWLYARNFYK